MSRPRKPDTKYNEDTIRYARQAIADLEAGKTFSTYNLGGTFKFEGKDDALGWMYTSLGYLTYQKDKKEGVNYLFKASQLNSTANKVPLIYRSIGDTYADEARRLAGEADALGNSSLTQIHPRSPSSVSIPSRARSPLHTATLRALDAYTRAHNASTVPAYKDQHDEDDLSCLRLPLRQSEGLKAGWTRQRPGLLLTDGTGRTGCRPGLNVTTVTTTTTIPASPSAVPVSNPGAAKPAPAGAKPAAAPAAKPTAGTKPQASTKKAVKKKAA